MRRLALFLLLIFAAAPLRAQQGGGGGQRTGPLTRGLADALYCALSGCTMTGPIYLANGSAAAPSLALANSPTTGIFRSASNVLGFSTNGVERWVINSSGALNCSTDGGCDIGNGAADPRDLSLKRNLILRGSTSGTTTVSSGAVAAASVLTLPVATDTLVGKATTDTLTNKSVDLTSNTLTGTTAQFNTALSDGDFATLAGAEALTNKTLDLASNTVTGTTAQFNTALSDGDFATLAGAEALTNKTSIGTGTLQTTGHIGVQVAPSATAGLLLLAREDNDAATSIVAQNASAAGTNASGGVFEAKGSTADVFLGGWGSGRTATRFGVTIGGYSELAVAAGNGLLIGTLTATPVIIGTNSAANLTISSGGAISASSTLGVTGATSANGGLIRGITTQTGATYTVAATDTHIIANMAGTITLTLGTATIGRELTVRTITANTVVSASSNVVPCAGGSAGTAILAATAGKWAYLVGDGTNWQIQMCN